MQNIGKYEIHEKIGSGGFGVVYKGFDPLIKRNVAIKTCVAEDPEVRQRFSHEAEIVGSLNHRNITAIYDFGIQDEIPYIVQEYLSGEDLDHKIKRREAIPYPEKLIYLMDIARGLAHAHANNIVHRDIKPGNIRILDDSSAKIMDFGIAQLAQQATGLTQTGMTLGTAAYLAPEQIRGGKSDARTDIFSFGVLAYELLTLIRPFHGDNISAVLYQILGEEARPLVTLWPDCPGPLAQLVNRCMAKDPHDRYSSFDEVLSSLQRLDQVHSTRQIATIAQPVPSHPPSPPATPTRQPPEQPRPRSLADMDLSPTRSRHRGSATPAAARAVYTSSRPRGFLLGLFVVLGLVATGLWWWQSQNEGFSFQKILSLVGSGTETSQDSPAEPAELEGLPSGPASTSSDPALPAATVESPGTESSDAAANATSATNSPAAETEPVQEAPAEIVEPPPPTPATLTLLPGWDDRITVSINGRRPRRLNERTERQLPPGTYSLLFELVTDKYTDSKLIQKTLKEGEKTRFKMPLPRPGVLTVQVKLSTAQGLVQVDGELKGETPLFGLYLRPGPHTVGVLRRDDMRSPAQQVEIDQGSGIRTVVTFDLSQTQQPEVRTSRARRIPPP